MAARGARESSVECVAFGPRRARPPPPPPPPGARLLPLGATVVLVALVAWSITKGIEYQEVFAANGRYRAALVGVNAAAIAAAMLVVASSAAAPPRC